MTTVQTLRTTRQAAPLLACGRCEYDGASGTLQFDWRGVAASAIGTGIGQAVGGALGLPADGTRPGNMDVGAFIGKSFVKGFAAGLGAAVARGGKIVIQQIAVDAFGNALGYSVAEANWGGSQQDSQGSYNDGDIGRSELRLGRGAALPDMAEVSALNRQIVAHEPPGVDPQDVDLVAGGEGVSLNRSSRVTEPQAMHRASERQYRSDLETIRGAYLERGFDPGQLRAAWQRVGFDDARVRAAYGATPAPASSARSAPPLPEILYQDRAVGGVTQASSMGWREAFNSNNSIGEQFGFAGLAALSTPVAIVESVLYAPFNAGPAINETGQYVARARLQSDPDARNMDILAAISTGAEAFSSIGAWLVGPRPQASLQTAEELARVKATYAPAADVPNTPIGANSGGVRAYPDGSFRTPDGKFASAAGMPAPGTVNANNYAEFLKTNGVNVVGTELEVSGPLGVRKYDIGTRNADGTIFGIEIKSGEATKGWYQEFTDMYVNRFGAAGRGRIAGERVTGSMTIYLPSGGH